MSANKHSEQEKQAIRLHRKRPSASRASLCNSPTTFSYRFSSSATCSRGSLVSKEYLPPLFDAASKLVRRFEWHNV